MNMDLSGLKVEDHPNLLGVPSGVRVEYFGRVPWPGYEADNPVPFCVLCPDHDNWHYRDFVLVVGIGGENEIVPITEVVRFRDGGTTEITTKQGTFMFPSPFRTELKPTFDGKPITVYPWNRS